MVTDSGAMRLVLHARTLSIDLTPSGMLVPPVSRSRALRDASSIMCFIGLRAIRVVSYIDTVYNMDLGENRCSLHSEMRQRSSAGFNGVLQSDCANPGVVNSGGKEASLRLDARFSITFWRPS